MDNKPTIEQIARWNVEAAEDQRHEYNDQSENVLGQWFEGDAYLQNTVDTIRENGYNTYSDWEEVTGFFHKLAEEANLRFAN